MNDKKILLDIKTSNAIYPFYWLQLAAYKKLYESIGLKSGGIDEVAILWLNAKTRTNGSKGAIQGIGWQLVNRDADLMQRDIEMFEATHKLWLAENGTMQPKKLQYQLTHKL